MTAQTQVLPLQLANGQVVLAMVDTLGGEEDVAARMLSFGGAISVIRGLATELEPVFAAVKPQKATVEFGVRLAAQAGALTALLVDAKGDATLKLTLQWGGEGESH